ncbi:cold-shock protein [Nocardia takedensis]
MAWYNTEKGFGFLTPDRGGPPVFVRHDAIAVPGYKTMLAGQAVRYTAHDTPAAPKPPACTPSTPNSPAQPLPPAGPVALVARSVRRRVPVWLVWVMERL